MLLQLAGHSDRKSNKATIPSSVHVFQYFSCWLFPKQHHCEMVKPFFSFGVHVVLTGNEFFFRHPCFTKGRWVFKHDGVTVVPNNNRIMPILIVLSPVFKG